MPRIHVTLTADEEQAEIWKPAPGYEGHYEVSNFGRVQSLKNYHGFLPGRIMSMSTTHKGYVRVTLSMQSKLLNRYVHVLVAAAFNGPCPPKHEVNHKNGKKWDNRASNLEYKTRKGNMEHAAATGLLPTPEQHSATMKIHAARGDKNGSRTHPEAFGGDNHWTRKYGQRKGADSPCSKLTDEQRKAICEEYAVGDTSYHRLGIKYGINAQTAWNVVNGARKRSRRPSRKTAVTLLKSTA